MVCCNFGKILQFKMNEFFCIFVSRLKYNVKPNSFIMKKHLHLVLLLFVFAGFANAQGLGEKVFEGSANGDVFEYDFSHQGAGVYLIRVETVKGIETMRVTVK